MKFIAYDIIFLVLFTLLVAVFLYTRRSNLKREGLLYLYKTNVGLHIIESTSKRYASLLRPLQYLIVLSGYVLMAFMLWFLGKFTYLYLTSPSLAQDLRVPVLTPLIPYIDQLFKVEFLPPFYFTYWIIIIAIIAVPHEFAHGIIARLNKVRIHSTGFGFLGPFLAAFVEQDEKDMKRAKKFPQLAILAAGTFANVLATVLCALIFWLFVAAAFHPAGIYFNTYAAAIVNTSDIQQLQGISFTTSTLDTINISQELVSLITKENITYFASPLLLQKALQEQHEQIIVYEDSAALRAKMKGAITQINDIPIKSYEDLSTTIPAFRPGDKVSVKTINKGNTNTYNVTLGEREGRAFLGVGFVPFEGKGIRGAFYRIITTVKDPQTYYESSLGNLGIFIYDLLWWAVLVNISVALVNMLPVGLFDGGRFFMLTVWGITGRKDIAEKAFKITTAIILAIVAILMLKWVIAIF